MTTKKKSPNDEAPVETPAPPEVIEEEKAEDTEPVADTNGPDAATDEPLTPNQEAAAESQEAEAEAEATTLVEPGNDEPAGDATAPESEPEATAEAKAEEGAQPDTSEDGDEDEAVDPAPVAIYERDANGVEFWIPENVMRSHAPIRVLVEKLRRFVVKP